MPFFSFDSPADLGLDSNFSSLEVSSVFDTAGTEYLANYSDEFYADIGINPNTLSTFTDAPISDFANINEWAEVGSKAGDADWYDAFYGEDLTTPSPVDDPFEIARQAVEQDLINNVPTELDILRELPFADQVKAIGSQIVTDFKIFGQDAVAAIQQISNFSPIINAVSSVFGIPSPVAQIIQPISQAAGVATAVTGTAGLVANPNTQSIFTDPVVRSALYATVGLLAPEAGRTIQQGLALYDLGRATGAIPPPTTSPSAVNTGPLSGEAFNNLNTPSILTDPAARAALYATVGIIAPEAGRAINTGVALYDLSRSAGAVTTPTTTTPGTVTTDATGLVILDEAQTAQLERNISPIYRSSAVDATNSLYVPITAEPGATFRELTVEETIKLESFVDPRYRSIIDLPTDPAKRETYVQALETIQTTTTALNEFDAYKSQTTADILKTSDDIYNINARLEDPTTTEQERILLEEQLAGEYEKLAVSQSALEQTNTAIGLVSTAREQAAVVVLSTEASTVKSAAPVGGAVDQYSMVKNANGTYSVFDRATNTTVLTGLTEQAAISQVQALGITAPGITEKTATPVAVDGGDLGEIVITASRIVNPPAGITTAETNQARQQQTIRELRNNAAQSGDWRVRLRLAPNSNYLYNAPSPGILSELKATDGVIFPYTPSIETAYIANYDPYELTHSNYRSYFYKGSHVDAINVRGTFTAQDSKEADYLLAVIHFFRSCTKMFYGKDEQRGAPPPLVYLNGYGDYQFSEHPCVVSQFNYTLPPDVDYIRAQNALTNNTNLLNNRLRNPIANNPLAYSVNRLLNSKLVQGALDFRPTLVGTGNLGISSPTYVPTKMEISITLLPIQSRSQISNNFSVKEFANGNLLKGGYW